MSRLATLSSNMEHYKDAIRSLILLYVARGYPENLVVYWARSNALERWEKRLSVPNRAEEPDVLVLKTEYNLAWNYFNAQQLGDTIFGYWREWLNRLDLGKFDSIYPPPRNPDFGEIDGNVDTLRVLADGTAVMGYDVRNTDILNRRVLTSRKRTKNLVNMTNLWKKVVLEHLDERVLEETLQEPDPQPVSDVVMATPLETAGEVLTNDSDNELQPARYRERSPGAPRGWAFQGPVERSDVTSGW
jgi:hypothetical protein